MDTLSLNVRGIGEDYKTRWVKKLKTLHKINFLGLHETQLSDFTKVKVSDCWDSTDFDYDGVHSSGRSGGIISIWDKSIFQKTGVLKGRHYLIVIGDWTGIT